MQEILLSILLIDNFTDINNKALYVTISDEKLAESEFIVTVPLLEKFPESVKSLPAFIVRTPEDSTVRFVT